MDLKSRQSGNEAFHFGLPALFFGYAYSGMRISVELINLLFAVFLSPDIEKENQGSPLWGSCDPALRSRPLSV